MSHSVRPLVFVQENQPDWGLGIVLEERPDRWMLLFERGGERTFLKHLAKGLKQAAISDEEARALDARLRGRQPQKGVPRGAKARKADAPRPSPKFATFEEQLGWFEKKFAGGFYGEKFILEERGHPDLKGKLGYKNAAMALAREQLSPERFQTATPEELFASARRLVGATNIVFPQEGAIPFGAIKPERRGPLLVALQDLLHGAGDYGQRLERFVRGVDMADAEGKPRPVTWPLATVFSAMYHPAEHVCVKPTYFSWQAPLVGLAVEKSQPVTGAGYDRFLEVARTTQQRLLAVGHRPRDLMDVYSFIWRTHAEKTA